MLAARLASDPYRALRSDPGLFIDIHHTEIAGAAKFIQLLQEQVSNIVAGQKL